MTTIVTGAAGFIGFHLCQKLLAGGHDVIGLDSLNDYYDPRLKSARLDLLVSNPRFRFTRADVADHERIGSLMSGWPDAEHIVHLAAQAGVRYSLENPFAYVSSNVMGQVAIMEACRSLPRLRHLVYASSSSVYGANQDTLFSEDHRVDRPVSLYAASKRSAELMAESYARLYQLPMTGLRFFSVYGPWGRPDMAAYIFTKAIREGRPIQVYNRGNMRRAFTYIDDIVAGVTAALDRPPSAVDGHPPHRIYNLGNESSAELGYFIELIEQSLGTTAAKELLPMQPGDVRTTCANIDRARRDLGYAPRTPLEDGIPRFVDWFLDYHGA